MHKAIELVKRKPGLPVEAFQARWRDHHGPLLTDLPGLRRYVQSHALLKGYAKGELLFDGIGEFWFDSAEAFAAARRSSAWRAAEDEAATLTDTARTVLMEVDVHVAKDGAIPDGAVKNIEFVNRRLGMDLDAFRSYWCDVHGPIASRIPVLWRYEQNHLKRAAYTAGAPAYDGLAVTWFASTADMKQGTTTEEYRITRADEPNFLPDGHLPIIITREHVIVG